MSLCTPSPPPMRAVSRISSPFLNIAAKRRKITCSPQSPAALSSISTPSTLLDSSYLSQNFITIRKLGEGDFGEVKEVQSKHSHVRSAIKVFKVDKMKVKSGLNYTKDNLKEIRAHMSLPHHPHLIQFIQAWKEDGHLYLQMELSQHSLDEYWKMKKELTEKDIEKAVTDCLLALKHLSSHNIAHLDIKPQNILRSESGVYKLADFSVTVDLSKPGSSSGEFGTGRFAAPELLNGLFTTKADLFSLGLSIVQVSVPSGEPLSAQEWSGSKEEGILPTRVAEALPDSIAAKMQSMISDISTRPSAEELLNGIDTEEDYDDIKNTNVGQVRKMMKSRFSLSPTSERQLRENKSPLVKQAEASTTTSLFPRSFVTDVHSTSKSSFQNPAVIFHTSANFFEMERPLRHRASTGPRIGLRRAIAFSLEDD